MTKHWYRKFTELDRYNPEAYRVGHLDKKISSEDELQRRLGRTLIRISEPQVILHNIMDKALGELEALEDPQERIQLAQIDAMAKDLSNLLTAITEDASLDSELIHSIKKIACSSFWLGRETSWEDYKEFIFDSAEKLQKNRSGGKSEKRKASFRRRLLLKIARSDDVLNNASDFTDLAKRVLDIWRSSEFKNRVLLRQNPRPEAYNIPRNLRNAIDKPSDIAGVKRYLTEFSFFDHLKQHKK